MTANAPSSRGRMGRSRLGGVPTALAPPHAPRQLALGIAPATPVPARGFLFPGAVKIASWLDPDAQRRAGRGLPPVGAAAGGAPPPAGAHRPPDERPVGVPRLALAALRLLADGRRHRRRTGEAAARSTSRAGPARGRRRPAPRSRYAPDAAIVNLYAAGRAARACTRTARSRRDAPVVTISLGDTCVFRLAGVDRRTGPFTDVELALAATCSSSAGRNRRIYHGVPKVLDGTAPRRARPAPGPAQHHHPRDRAVNVARGSAAGRGASTGLDWAAISRGLDESGLLR